MFIEVFITMLNRTLPNIYTRTLRTLFRRAPIRVGIVLEGKILPYSTATAVARLRVYDVIEMFAQDSKIIVELYQPWRNYDVVILEKTFTQRALALARALKRKNVKLLLDVNVDYFSLATPRVTAELQRVAIEMAKIVDGIMAPSPRLVQELRERQVHSRITYVPEPIADRYFQQHKSSFARTPRLLWCGYYQKAAELKSITEQVQAVQAQYGASLILISDRDPGLSIGRYTFIRYQEKNIATNLARGDVFIAPRRFDRPYKYHHTFTKIGLPMAVGLPVIASPMPSYLSSPALLCYSQEDWMQKFQALYAGEIDLANLSKKGRDYCRAEFSWDRIKSFYTDLFSLLLTTSR